MAIGTHDAERLVKESLLVGYRKFVELGEKGRELAGHQIDITTRADVEVGNAVIDHLKDYDICAVFSEEFGKKILNSSCKNSAVEDDIDGSLNSEDGRNMLPFGTIVGIFENPEPVFDECMSMGFLEYTSGNIYFATKGAGAYVIENFARDQSAKLKKISTTGRKTIGGDKPFKLLPDIYMLGSVSPYFVNYSDRAWLGDFRSKAVHFAMVASGAADVFVAGDNCYNPKKRATGEELASAYLLVKEAGGAVLDWSKNDIGPKNVGLGEGQKKTFHFVAAATEDLASEFIDEMRKKPRENVPNYALQKLIHDYISLKHL